MTEKTMWKKVLATILLLMAALLLAWLGGAARCAVPQLMAGDWMPLCAEQPGQVCRLTLRATGGLRAPSDQYFHCPRQAGWEMRWPLSWRCVGCRCNGLVWEAEMAVWPVVREPLEKTLLAVYLPARLELRSPGYASGEQGELQPAWENPPSAKQRRFSRLWGIPVLLYALWRLCHWLSPRQRAWRRVRSSNTPQELHDALLFFRPALASELGEALLNRVDELRFAPASPSEEDFAAVKALALHLVT